MDDHRLGRAIRALRHRLSWRQVDLGNRAGVSQDLVSLVERGRLDAMPLRTIRAVAAALDATVLVTIRWRGGDLDRLIDEGHAAIVGQVIAWFASIGWDLQPEVTFSVYGERGSIDVLAWHAPSRTLLVIEVKTALTSVEETLRRHDVKARLAPNIAAERFGWRAKTVARLLVLPDTSTARRHVGRHDLVLGRAYPVRGDQLRAQLRSGALTAAGLLFVSGQTARRLTSRRIRGTPC
jgi:transcriptional regulator with XRE-family HTH domain